MTSKQINRSAIRRTNPRTRPYNRRMRKRGNPNPNSIDSLPDELLSDILLRLRVEDIHENARFVCKRWKRMIHGEAFVYAHLHRSSHGLLVSLSLPRYRPDFITATQRGIEIYGSSCEFGYSIRGSCNGLILGTKVNRWLASLYIVNPATKRRFDLPRSFDSALLCHFGIGYAAASVEYKVVGTYLLDPPLMLAYCSILTVGVDDAWRHIATHRLSSEANRLLDSDPLITEGFMHWASSLGNDVLTMNVETEVFAETPAPLAPLEYGVEGFKYYYLSTGRHLSVLFPCGEYSWEAWEMEGESGEWRRPLPNIDLKAHKSEIEELSYRDGISLTPVGWVKYPVVLLFIFDDKFDFSYVIYNLDNDEIDSIEFLVPVSYDHAHVVHKNSLVCLS